MINLDRLRAWRLHRHHQRQALTDGQALQLLRARANQHNTSLTIDYSETTGWEVKLMGVAYTFDDTFSGAAIDAYELTHDHDARPEDVWEQLTRDATDDTYDGWRGL